MPISLKAGDIAPNVQLEAARIHAQLKQLGFAPTHGAELRAQFVTQNPFMSRQVDRAIMARDRRENVLITGESGTGKEILANIAGTVAFMDSRGQANVKFLAVNCAGISDTLFESELFGHVRGSFTGAMRDRQGILAAADGGCVFLDEIGELPMNQQAKLLRAIQNRRITPVGSDEEVEIRCRFIFATNRNLKREVAAGRFREDLYYRIAQITIETIPLRARPEDVMPITDRIIFLNGYTPWGKLSDDPEMPPRWSYARGNVRQLQNVLLARELGDDWVDIEAAFREEDETA